MTTLQDSMLSMDRHTIHLKEKHQYVNFIVLVNYQTELNKAKYCLRPLRQAFQWEKVLTILSLNI